MRSAAFGPYEFEPTPDEAKIAASRAALRGALSGGLTARHLAPLAAFVLAMAFAAILAWTDLITRRHGEIALLLAASAFMIHRISIRRRFIRARRESTAAVETMRSGKAIVASADETGLEISGARWEFADCVDAEDAGGMVYLWPRSGAPAFLPTRVFGDEAAAREFVAYARARLGRPVPPLGVAASP